MVFQQLSGIISKNYLQIAWPSYSYPCFSQSTLTWISCHVDNGDEDAAGGAEDEGPAVALHPPQAAQQRDDGHHRRDLKGWFWGGGVGVFVIHKLKFNVKLTNF